MEVRKEVAFFDEFAAAHGDYDVLGEGAYRRLLSLFAQLANPRPGDRCADLGCGTGAFTKHLRRYRLRLVGVDISPQSVAQAARSADGERYVVGDISCLGLADRALDIVVFSGVLHHCDRRDQRVSILREARRVLRPGGALFAFDPSAHSPSMWLYRDPASPLHSTKGKTDNEVLLRRDELTTELSEAGFGDIEVRGAAGITFRYVEGRLARLLLPFYNLYERALRWSPLEDRFGTFLVSSARRPAGAGDRTA
jgi:ubiquinone/menaquinone biosynthesis C-methylase UbiE